jgi:hypothetical protein
MMNTLTAEQVMALYFNDKALRTQPMPVRRVETNDGRYYISLSNDRTDLVYVPSVTTIIKNTSKMPYHLLKWYVEHGWERAEEIKTEAADYGTLMHIAVATYLTSRKLNLSAVPMLIEQYRTEHRITYNTDTWQMRLWQDLLAFHTFATDYQIEPIAIEMPLVSNMYKFGGAIDLVCEATFTEKGFFGEVYKTGDRKGEPKESKQERREVCLIDFKSGRHGFYEEHELQVDAFYKTLWNENFPELPVKRCFNWSPKNWVSEPGYLFTEQTGKSSTEEMFLHCQKFSLRYAKPPVQNTEFAGLLELGKPAPENVIRKHSVLNELRREWESQGIMTPREQRFATSFQSANMVLENETPQQDEAEKIETSSLFTQN